MEKQSILSTILKNVLTYKKYIIITITSIIALFALYSIYNHFNKETIVEQNKTSVQSQIPKVKQVQNTKTTFAYEPKQVVNGVKEDTDVEAVVEQPKVTVKVNGQNHKFDLKQGETQKFQDGKVVMNQTSEVVFDVKVPDRHELTVYAQEELRANQFHHVVGVEKRNGKLHYGAEYDFKDKEPSYFVRYDVKKVYTN